MNFSFTREKVRFTSRKYEGHLPENGKWKTGRAQGFGLSTSKYPRRGSHASAPPPGDAHLKKKLVFEIFITGVVVFDALASDAFGLPVLQYIPMWFGAMLEIEIGARVLGWLSRWAHSHGVFGLGKASRRG